MEGSEFHPDAEQELSQGFTKGSPACDSICVWERESVCLHVCVYVCEPV